MAHTPNTRDDGTMLERWKARARELKREVQALLLALRDRRTPALAKVVAWCVIAYALSPIDLIPDVIPVLGLLDDLVLLPLGIALAVRLTPAPVLDDCRERARRGVEGSALASRLGAAVIVTLWLLLAAGVGAFLLR
ncbi:MAG: hypothetical protein AVDCRST_MAG88-3525 [uncultured Thermomicrobiales bacterium]|uniref:DUF1232 domain-containing protein n=1 Tax=uncultured Thermomicrobiales bacterium TaxID=1645740 RepID=A0A6J4VMC0_9BACT|nr:MAG: hypothetical protein AVDCRST_MAG88-3525 [uncultured Thermomicrobiales bacterium]